MLHPKPRAATDLCPSHDLMNAESMLPLSKMAKFCLLLVKKSQRQIFENLLNFPSIYICRERVYYVVYLSGTNDADNVIFFDFTY